MRETDGNEHRHLHPAGADEIKYLFGEWIPKYLYELDAKYMIDGFTIGYHVEAFKSKYSKIEHV
jgi:hypothetical protein